MDEFDFTPAQARAIHCIDKNVAVSAGAGSGKTRVLVQRFLHILAQGLQQPEQTVLPQEILAVTFTRKAAAEMLERIRKEVAKKAAEGSEREYWQKQLKGMDSAQIETIHSFCSALLRANPAECGLDPAFTIMEETDHDEFIEAETRSLLRNLLKGADPAAATLCNEYGSRSLLEQTRYLLKKGITFQKGSLLKGYSEMLAEIRQEAGFLQETLSPELVGACSPANKSVLEQNLEALWSALSDIESPDNRRFLQEIMQKLTRRGKCGDVIGQIKDRAQAIASYPLCRKAVALVPFWEAYLLRVQQEMNAKKRSLGILGFDDLEEMALELLEHHADVLERCRRRFRYIMVDEFQDTNERQRQLIYLLSGGNKDLLQDHRLFVVGDSKQSIYRFRGADVSVFARVRNEIGKNGGEAILLNDNFRTVKPVLDFCNDIFPKMMGEERDNDVFYEALQAHRESDAKPELCVFRYTKDIAAAAARQKEAQWLAARLAALRSEGYAFKDMAILLQKMTHVAVLTEALRQQGVPYAVVDGRGFYERIEIQDLMNLFAFVVDSHDDLNLAGVLRSVYIGLHDTTLTQLFLALPAVSDESGNKLSLWEFLLQNDGVAEKLPQAAAVRRGVSVLQRLLTAGTVLNLPEFCREIKRLLHPETVLAMQHNGEEQLADLRKFFRMADTFAAEKQGTVRDFVLRLQQMQEEEVREAAADVAAEDAVLLMTVHKSKGLEFPVTAIPFMEAAAKKDTERAVYLPEMGLGISVRDDSGKLVRSLVLDRIKEFSGQKEQEEKIRLLYVAITRAKDRLILSGSLKETKSDSKGESLQAKGESKTKPWLKDLLAVVPEGYPGIVRTEVVVDAAAAGETDLIPVKQNEKMPGELLDRLLRQAEPLASFGGSSMTWFSASALQEYEICPRRYYYQVIEQIPPSENEAVRGEKLPAHVLGSLVHAVLEKYAKWRMEHQFREEESVWRDFYTEAVEELAGGRCDLAAEAEDMLRAYLQSPLYRDFSARQVFAEYGFQLPLLQDDKHSYMITGFIDGIAVQPDGSLQLVDYKSGRNMQDGSGRSGYAWQLTLYKLAAEKLLAKPVSKASLHYIRSQSEWVLPDGEYRQKILRLCGAIADKKTEEEFAVKTEHCAYCPFSYMCRNRLS